MCAFELNDTKQMQVAIKVLTKLTSNKPVESIVLKSLQKIENENKKLSIRELNKMRIKIDDYYYDTDIPIKHLEFTPFYDWVNSKTKGK